MMMAVTVNNMTSYEAVNYADWLIGRTWYVGLMTTKASKLTNGVEEAAADYARQACTLEAVDEVTLPGKVWNATTLSFGTPATDWGTIEGITLWLDAEGGDPCFFIDLTTPTPCPAGAPVSIPAHTLTELGA